MTAPNPKQIDLLRLLLDSGGHVSWADLSQGQCREGTMLERIGLCKWVPCPPAEGTKRLEITEKGRAAIGKSDG
jgi:hypothetical protein